jgi:hypothetical protein
MRWLGLPLAIAGSLLILSTSVAGQMITGRVLVETDTVGVDGYFRIPVPSPGQYEIRSGTLDEYYDRMEENRTRGIGNFVTAEEIERQASFNASTLLRGVPRKVLVDGSGSWTCPRPGGVPVISCFDFVKNEFGVGIHPPPHELEAELQLPIVGLVIPEAHARPEPGCRT